MNRARLFIVGITRGFDVGFVWPLPLAMEPGSICGAA